MTQAEVDAYNVRRAEARRAGKVLVALPCKPSRAEQITEKEMHRQFGQWLNQKGMIFREDRMDKPTTGPVGWPDFTICHNGKTVFVEMKTPGKMPTEEQRCYRARLESAGFTFELAYSVQDAIRFVLEQWPEVREWVVGYFK